MSDLNIINQIPELYNKFYKYLMIQNIGSLILEIALIMLCIFLLYKIFYNKKEKRFYSVEEFCNTPWYIQCLIQCSLVLIMIVLFICLFGFFPNTVTNLIELNVIPEVKVTSYIFSYFNK